MRRLVALVSGLLLGACGGESHTPCGAGTHDESGTCVADLVCGEGTHPVDGACVADVECADGTREEDGRCVADPPCAEGTREVGGRCVADLSCGEGTVPENGVCVPEEPTDPRTSWGPNVRVSPGGLLGAEPSVAADGDGHVWVAYAEGDELSLYTVLAASDDGGASFTQVETFPSDHGYSGDVAMTATDDGTAYLAWIEYEGYSEVIGTVWVVATTDHGTTWSDPVGLNRDGGDRFNDRPWLAVGTDGVLHASWTTGPPDMQESMTLYARSEDAGDTWSVPLALDTGNYSYASAFSGIAVTDGGDVLVPLQVFDWDGAAVALARGPGSGPNPFAVALVDDIYYTRDLATNATPVIATAPGGRVCLAWIDAPERDLGIMVAVADDGLNFGEPVEVSGVASTQAMPWLAADADGRFHLVWIDNRSGEWETWSTIVETDGSLAPLERVSDASFAEDGSRQQWLGDFISIAVGGDRRYAVWTDTRDGSSAIFLSSAPVSGLD